MEWFLTILPQIFEVVILPLLGVLTAFLINFIKTKSKELAASTDDILAQKYITMFGDTVVACVRATNQTYVETLKKQGKFDADAQQIAFEMTYKAVMDILTDEAKEYLINMCGDLDALLTTRIEAEVNNTKNEIVK